MGGETSESDSDSMSDHQSLAKDHDPNLTKTVHLKNNRKTITKHRTQRYRTQWEKIPEFRPWLRADKSSMFKARCEKCDSTMISELTVIKKHAESVKHKERCAVVRSEVQKTLLKFVAPVDDKVQRAKIQLSGFLVAHNISFNIMDHLCGVLKNIFIDSKIAQELKLKRTKATAIVKNVIGDYQKEHLIKKLKCCQFSILTDESTDIAAVKTSCIVVRFYDEEAGRVISRFWDLPQIFGVDKSKTTDTNISSTAEHLFKKIIESFDEHNISHENIFGFGSDGCNTMMGSQNSVASRFRAICPGLTISKCVSHSLHLCASEACKRLPRMCEDPVSAFFGSRYSQNTASISNSMVISEGGCGSNC